MFPPIGKISCEFSQTINIHWWQHRYLPFLWRSTKTLSLPGKNNSVLILVLYYCISSTAKEHFDKTQNCCDSVKLMLTNYGVTIVLCSGIFLLPLLLWLFLLLSIAFNYRCRYVIGVMHVWTVSLFFHLDWILTQRTKCITRARKSIVKLVKLSSFVVNYWIIRENIYGFEIFKFCIYL